MDFPQHVIERFWRKVDKSAGPDGCWPFISAGQDGYGKFYADGKSYKAHRVSLCLSTGHEGNMALHNCDNRICCNPKHLGWGDARQNYRDMYNRNHAWRRVNNEKILKIRQRGILISAEKTRKMTLQQIQEASRLASHGVTFKELSEKYGISASGVYRHVTLFNNGTHAFLRALDPETVCGGE